MRNELVHDMSNKLFERLTQNTVDLYFEMLTLFEKMIKWWIVEIEIPTNPEFTVEQFENIVWDEISSVNIEFLKIMTDIVFTGNKKYYDMYMEQHKGG